jgi:hypothetical protein
MIMPFGQVFSKAAICSAVGAVSVMVTLAGSPSGTSTRLWSGHVPARVALTASLAPAKSSGMLTFCAPVWQVMFASA